MNEDGNAERQYQRWDIHQRIQHMTLLISFSTLIITGLPLRYAGAPTAQTITQAVGGAYAASVIHRIAAGLLILTAGYHLIYIGLCIYRGKQCTAVTPRWKDIADFIGMVKYNLGLAREKPRFGRYTFDQKFEYWALVWGCVLMIVTGSILLSPVMTLQYLPVILLKLSRVIHSAEALLAALAITVWHFYHAHLAPDVFPMSKIWLTGLISEKEIKKLHPLEYEQITRGSGEHAEQDDAANAAND